MSRKVKSFKQAVFVLKHCTTSKVITNVSKCSLSAWTQAHNRFATCLLPCR